ncbi:MAG TPA: hypothetical protein VF867_18630 [Arthrobacter sp.]
MSSKKISAARPVQRRRRTLRQTWPAVTAVGITTVMLAAGALASIASVPVAAAPVPVSSPTVAPPPVPVIGSPYLSELGTGRVASITIKSAVFTSPTVLTLDVAWDSWVGATMPDPMHLTVLDATGKRAVVHPLTEGALPSKAVEPGSPVHGLVAYDVTTGPATLVIKPAGAAEATRITVK